MYALVADDRFAPVPPAVLDDAVDEPVEPLALLELLELLLPHAASVGTSPTTTAMNASLLLRPIISLRRFVASNGEECIQFELLNQGGIFGFLFEYTQTFLFAIHL